jgi:hypothetical protein
LCSVLRSAATYGLEKPSQCAYDYNYYGMPVDPATGDVTENGTLLSSEVVGATLLAAADIDPGPSVSGVSPLTGVLG